ncbi:DUF1642 domain-containing protein [Lactococcus petauri]|uniref:DUF1642 domain-containing protein n=1 Tax=Lactococcus petauri TaxID=1940789 RepID=UPI001F051A1B|nr:DUF1642 domain-containing protein [Lactococcus petauri]MCH1712423.1 DUF1642 domain-containing protein [Lactococcus petauri]MDT2593715.1 DUF1642 domain-containing protein [Lactococcus petauri]
MNKVEAQIVKRPSIDPVTVANNANQALYKNCREWREYATALEEDVRNLSERVVELDSKSEEQQPEIPEFVAEFITKLKKANNNLTFAFSSKFNECPAKYWNEAIVWRLNHPEEFAQAWLNGYTVAKEKRFYIKVKNTCPTKYVWLNQSTKNIYFDNRSTNWTNNGNVKNIFTKSELTEIANGTLYKQEYEREELTDREWFNPLFELIPVDDEK